MIVYKEKEGQDKPARQYNEGSVTCKKLILVTTPQVTRFDSPLTILRVKPSHKCKSRKESQMMKP